MSLSLSALERKILEIVHADNRRGRRSTLATIEIALEESNAKRVGNSVITKSCWDLERLGLLATVKPTVTISAKGATVIGKAIETPAPEVVPEPVKPVQPKAPVIPAPPILTFPPLAGETGLNVARRLLQSRPEGVTTAQANEWTGLKLGSRFSELIACGDVVGSTGRPAVYRLASFVADDASPDVAPAPVTSPVAGPTTAEGGDTSAVAVVAPVADAAPSIVAGLVADAIGSWGAVSDLLSTLEQFKARVAELEAAAHTAVEQAVTAAADGWIREVVLDLSEALGVNVEATDPCVAWTDLLDEARRRKPVSVVISEAKARIYSLHEAQLRALNSAADILGAA